MGYGSPQPLPTGQDYGMTLNKLVGCLVWWLWLDMDLAPGCRPCVLVRARGGMFVASLTRLAITDAKLAFSLASGSCHTCLWTLACCC